MFIAMDPELSRQQTRKPFSKFDHYHSVPIAWYPILIGLVEGLKPTESYAAEIESILSPKKNSNIYVIREAQDEKTIVKYRLIGRAPTYFNMIEYVFDETDRKRPLLESKRSVYSKQGRVNYQNEDDIAYVQFEIKTEYEFNQEIGFKVPVRVSAIRNRPTGSWEKLVTEVSNRMLTTIQWSKPDEEKQDVEKLTKLVEGYRDEVEAQFR